MQKNTQIGIVVVALVIGAYLVGQGSSNTPQVPISTQETNISTTLDQRSKKLDCNNYLDKFEERMKSERITYGASVVDQFVIGYSPSLDTCVAGFVVTITPPEYPGLFGHEYSMFIYDVLTNVSVGSFSVLSEVLKHTNDTTSSVETKYSAAQQYAWEDWDAKLKELTNGQISVFRR